MAIKYFRKLLNPFSLKKVTTNGNIRVVDNDEIISCNTEIAEKVITFFCNVVKVLNNKFKENLVCNV